MPRHGRHFASALKLAHHSAHGVDDLLRISGLTRQEIVERALQAGPSGDLALEGAILFAFSDISHDMTEGYPVVIAATRNHIDYQPSEAVQILCDRTDLDEIQVIDHHERPERTGRGPVQPRPQRVRRDPYQRCDLFRGGGVEFRPDRGEDERGNVVDEDLAVPVPYDPSRGGPVDDPDVVAGGDAPVEVAPDELQMEEPGRQPQEQKEEDGCEPCHRPSGRPGGSVRQPHSHPGP
ncbi:MAG: hypothetical protein BWY99_02522 [Synergistetes bacterium ADurb.BinA166]|nr:MAG: hypothetical protein BWY99_02522 [Synergistetes bacterium ADurb.BinA166]